METTETKDDPVKTYLREIAIRGGQSKTQAGKAKVALNLRNVNQAKRIRNLRAAIRAKKNKSK